MARTVSLALLMVTIVAVSGCAGAPTKFHMTHGFRCCVFDGSQDSETRPSFWTTDPKGRERPFEGELTFNVEYRCRDQDPWMPEYRHLAQVAKGALESHEGKSHVYVLETGQTINDAQGLYRATANLTLADGRLLVATPHEYGQGLGEPCT